MTRTLTSRQEAEELGAAEQGQQALELASMGGGGVELEGKSATIKSISDSIQSSDACCISRSMLLCSAAGSHHQMNISNKEPNQDRMSQTTSLLLDVDRAPKKGTLTTGEELRSGGRENYNTSDGMKYERRIDRQTTGLGDNEA